MPNGEQKIELGKNYRFKNYEICERLKAKRIKFPAYYVGEWDGKTDFWLGDLTMVNPNRPIVKNIK